MHSRRQSDRPAGAHLTPSTAALQLPTFATSAAGSVLIAVFLGAVAGAAIASKPILVAALVAIVLAALGVTVALERPALAFGGLVVLMALIPTYAAPRVGTLLFVPAAAAAWVLAGVLAWRNAIADGVLFRPSAVDYAAGAFAALMAISLAFSARTSLSDYVHFMFLWAGPYLAARLLLRDVERPVYTVAISFALVTAALAPIAILEVLGWSNPFYVLKVNATEFNLWASQIDRFGQTRAVTSFGHPIAFSMFIASSALLSIAMAVGASKPAHRRAWYGMAALAVGVQALALSRTGWLMIAIGIVMIAVVTVRGSARRRLLVLLSITASVVLVTSLLIPKELQVLPGVGGSTEHNFTTSGTYREALLTRALEPGILHLWGNATNMVTPFVSLGTATDNSYIILADTWGLIPTAALIAVALSLLLAAARTRSYKAESLTIFPIVAFTGLVALFFVAFITQQQVMIWLLVGAAGAAAERATTTAALSGEAGR
jgi:hypothetical protein